MNNELTKTANTQMAERKRWLNPVADICDDDTKVLLRLEMPGVAKEQVDIQVEGNQLRIRGERSAEEPDDKRKYLVRERPRGSFQKLYTLDDTVDSNKIEARMEDGVLFLELGLKDAVKPRRIEIG